MWQLSNSWPNQFQNNLKLTWPSNTAGISLDSRLEYSKITHSYAKVSPFTWFLCWKLPIDKISSILSVFFTRLWLKCQTVFWWPSCTSARYAGSFDCLMTSLILITMDNGRGHCAYWQSCKFPNKPTEEWKKIRKMYAIKQIGWICQVHLGFGLSASAQVPDKPALAWVACPGILHRS